jgi:hypothetical protein
MAKKTEFNYDDATILLGRNVTIGLQQGVSLGGEVRYVDEETIVLVTEPKSTLEIETKVVHTIINTSRIDFIQFKTDRE